MAVKLHRCRFTWWRRGPCWRVQRELDRAGVRYELVVGPVRPSARSGVQALSGQRLYPVIEFEDGSAYREESAAMAETIRAGRLEMKKGRASNT